MSTRQPLIVANWKMHPTLADAVVLATAVKRGLEDIHHLEVVLCPPAPWLVPVAELLKHHPLHHLYLGAQNIWAPPAQAPDGAYTGEVSAEMLKHLVQYVIVGHSERVRFFHETAALISRKAIAVLEANLTPIICVGEVHRSSRSKDQVIEVLQGLLGPIPRTRWHDLVMAYEPIWAISTGDDSDPASGDYAETMAETIKSIVGRGTPVLYGGSVDSSNIAEFIHEDDIDGALVGSASLKAKELLKICEIASGIKK